jgi:hypothetical protein
MNPKQWVTLGYFCVRDDLKYSELLMLVTVFNVNVYWLTFFPLLLPSLRSKNYACNQDWTKTSANQEGRNTSERWRGAAAGGLLGFPARDVRICCSVSGPELRVHAREDDDDRQHPAPPLSPPTDGHKNNQISYTAPTDQVLYHCFVLSAISACISDHDVTIRTLNGVNEMNAYRRGRDLV